MLIYDLFCGCGGFSCGFIDNEIDNEFLGIDYDPIALKSYQCNIRPKTVLLKKIEEWNYKDHERPDVLIGSPPCQPHSKANKLRTYDTSLIEKFLEIKDYFNPKYWIMEEVETIEKYGLINEKYITYYEALDVGLPHRRKRMFAGRYPRFRPESFRGVQIGNVLWKQVVKTPIAHMRGIGHGQRDYRLTKEKYNELNKLLVDAGIITDPIRHPFNVNVMKWLMGFPQSYVLHGDKREQERQVGNAVSPLIGKKIWEGIKKKRPVRVYYYMKVF